MLNAGSLLGIVDRLFLGIIDEGLTGGDVLFQLLQRALELRVYSLCDSQHVVYRLYRLVFQVRHRGHFHGNLACVLHAVTPVAL